MSVRAQKGVVIEHILVDGMSIDRTMEIAEEIGGFDRIVREPDGGIYDAMNKGLSAATGDFVGFLNADDYFLRPDSLFRLLDHEAGASPDIVYGDVAFVDQHHRPTRVMRPRLGKKGLESGFALPHPAFYVRTSIARDIGGFDDRFSLAGDFDFMLRLAGRSDLKWSYRKGIVVCMNLGGASSSGLPSLMKATDELKSALVKNHHPVRARFVHVRLLLKLLEVIEGMWLRASGIRLRPPNRTE